MKKWWVRLSCLLLAMLLVVTVIPASAEGGEPGQAPEENPVKDFVLLLDCSGSLPVNDPNGLCMGAVKTFLNMLPVENARVSVITFGYTDEADPNGFKYTSDIYKRIIGDETGWALNGTRRVHELVSLREPGDANARTAIKNLLDEKSALYDKDDERYTPIGHALLAAVELLERNESTDEDACIILISDGVDQGNGAYNEAMIDPAAMKAGEHNWPIYSVQLNYANGDLGQTKRAVELLDRISSLDGNAENPGRYECKENTEVFDAFIKIISEFYYEMNADIRELKLPDEFSFEVPELTSETSVSIFGAGIDYMNLYCNGKLVKEGIKGSLVEGNLTVLSEQGGYYTLKYIVPDMGEWKLEIYGTNDAVVKVANTNLREMNLRMDTSLSGDHAVLTRTDSIQVDSYFTYQGHDLFDHPFYAAPENKPAVLYVYSRQGGAPKTFPMTADQNGYHAQVSVSDLPSGELWMRVELDNVIFSGGEKFSNSQSLTVKNEPVTVKENAEALEVKGYVNSTLDRIDVSKFFNYPDSDEVTYTLSCESHTGKVFEMNADGNRHWMDVQAGFEPGTYQLSISARDHEQATPAVYNKLTLVIENRDPVYNGELPKLELWNDRFGFQDESLMMGRLRLDNYFTDPDGMPMHYSVSVSDGSVLSCTEYGGVLTLEPGGKGEVTVKVTGSDGVNGSNSASGEFVVKVVSGKMVFWRQNWIYFAIGAGVLAIIILAIIILLKNKRVKGTWDVEIDENGNVAQLEGINIGDFTQCGKRSHFPVQDMLIELVPFMDGAGTGLDLKIPSYFAGCGADKMEMVGVFGARGCTLNKVPKSEYVEVACNGISVSKGKASISSGTLVIRLTDSSTGDYLSVSMRI